ncbi:MAG: gamma carbonic anhydrase family protein [Fusobacterium perfoetens]|uniref:gamma carbonic anhydrase family protein n=1 Tax=Fusobacterium perfoetens TaxID=852 RepID=UPI0023F0DDDD|nr:gamma carbonic anhydrase family protein [Fusobacterium perfoetens]MCI6152053.1 gamma carbonic anhydrase family protein [Fusobacterium perfoetens]MDY3238056.1 gamma carbonic anhydrase family protein [Fusobacterium perfoetens]
MLFKLGNNIPKIGEKVFIADTARIIGNVNIQDDVSIWYGVVLRGDILHIEIGEGSNIQEGTTVHGEHNADVVIGKNVTIGHNCLIHGAKIGDNSLIGMGTIITDNVEIPKNCFVSSRALVTSKIGKIEEGSFIKGNPAKVVGKISEEQLKMMIATCKSYQDKKDLFLETLEEIK